VRGRVVGACIGAVIVALPFLAAAQDAPAPSPTSSPEKELTPDDRAAPSDPPPAEPPAKDALTPPRAHDSYVEYPEGATGRAEVVLELTINPHGDVVDATVISGAPLFDDAALAAARRWRFDPAQRGGRAVAARIRYTVRFEPAPEAKQTLGLPKVNPAEPVRPSEPGAAQEPATAPLLPRVDAEQPFEVVVRGERQPPGSVTVTRGEARNLPGSFGDPLRAIEAQPGVIPIVSGVPSFFIRGAPPANVGFFIDGVDVPLLYHAFLGPSVIHPGLIDSVDLYRGAAPVEYGRFAGPIVSANMRPFDRRFSAEGTLRAIDVGGLAEVPFGDCGPGAPAGCSRGSARVSGRYSYTGLVLSLLSNADLRYWDYQAQTSYTLGPHDTVSIFSFGAFDYFRSDRTAEQDQGGKVSFHRLDLRWDRKLPSGESLRVALTGGFDRTGGTEDTESQVTGQSMRLRVQWSKPLGSRATLRAGLDTRGDKFELRTSPLYLSFTDYSVLFPARLEGVVGAYTGLEWEPSPGIVVAPGVRADYYVTGEAKALGVDPRLTATFAVTPDVRIETSLGIAHQRPNFAAQVPGAQVANLAGGLQQAVMFSSGVKWKLPANVTANVTGFRTGYFNALDPIGGGRDFSIDRTMLDRRATISASGIEIGLARSLTRALGGFVSYTLSHSEQTSGRRRTISGFDRPHVLQVALSYDFGRGVRAGIRSMLYSGVPALLLEGSPKFSADKRGTPYFRADLRIEKRWILSKTSYWAVSGEILNATSTKEVVRIDCGGVCVERFAGPVILPSIGVEGGF
jgi:TonB family protein